MYLARMAMGQDMGSVELYHAHTCIVNGYKILPIPMPIGTKIYSCTYP
jgi:hypothetical protein